MTPIARPLCPTCGLAPAPLEEIVRVCTEAVESLTRIRRGGLTARQRAEMTVATTTIDGLRQLFLDEHLRQASTQGQP